MTMEAGRTLGHYRIVRLAPADADPKPTPPVAGRARPEWNRAFGTLARYGVTL